MMQWKKAFVQSEHLKQEHLKTQFESLKNHIDPHFLFNNLNILSSLIDSKNEDAQSFLDSFSEVYRYVLQNKGSELVKVEKELEFMEAYFYMLSRRFKGSLTIDTEVSAAARKKYLPPLSLQILLENIVKHNVINADYPLKVEVKVEGGKYLIVRNNLRRKKLHSYSAQSGLKNISRRYNFLSDEVIKVVDDGTSFTVKLPLLTMDWL
jgi:LytS/YehU family sensor histidine kinase